jgi:hypothetical protein
MHTARETTVTEGHRGVPRPPLRSALSNAVLVEPVRSRSHPQQRRAVRDQILGVVADNTRDGTIDPALLERLSPRQRGVLLEIVAHPDDTAKALSARVYPPVGGQRRSTITFYLIQSRILLALGGRPKTTYETLSDTELIAEVKRTGLGRALRNNRHLYREVQYRERTLGIEIRSVAFPKPPCKTISCQDIKENQVPEGLQTLLDAWEQVKNANRTEELLSLLNDKEKRVLELRVINSPRSSLGKIGKELGLTRERIRQIEVKIVLKCIKILKPPEAERPKPHPPPPRVRKTIDRRLILLGMVQSVPIQPDGLTAAEARIFEWAKEGGDEYLNALEIPGNVKPYSPLYSLIRKLERYLAAQDK